MDGIATYDFMPRAARCVDDVSLDIVRCQGARLTTTSGTKRDPSSILGERGRICAYEHSGVSHGVDDDDSMVPVTGERIGDAAREQRDVSVGRQPEDVGITQKGVGQQPRGLSGIAIETVQTLAVVLAEVYTEENKAP